MKTFWNVVKLNLVFVLIGHLVGLVYNFTDWQLYVYIVSAVLLVQLREVTLFEEK